MICACAGIPPDELTKTASAAAREGLILLSLLTTFYVLYLFEFTGQA